MLVKKDKRFNSEYISAKNGKIPIVALIETAKDEAIILGNIFFRKLVNIGHNKTIPITQK